MIKNGKPKFFYGYVIVSAAFITMVIARGTVSSFGVFFESVLLEFGWTRAITAGAFSLNRLIPGFLAIGVGWFNDKFGPRLLVTTCGFLLGLGYLLMSQVSIIYQLYLVYGLIIGTGLSCYFIPLVSTTARWFVKRRGIMTGVVTAGVGTGTIIMPLVASWLISSYGWRFSYTILAIISFASIVLVAQFLKREPQSQGQLPDGNTEAEHKSLNLATDGFSIHRAIRTRQLWVLTVISLFQGFTLFAIIVHVVIHATGLGIPVISAATILALAGATNIVGRLGMGSAIDRIGSRLSLIIGFCIMLIALVWLQFAKELWMFYIFGVIFGFAWGGAGVQASTMVAELFGLKSHGVLLGVSSVGFSIGGTIGPILLGYIFDITGSYQLGFLILSIVNLMGLILALLLQPVRKVEATATSPA